MFLVLSFKICKFLFNYTESSVLAKLFHHRMDSTKTRFICKTQFNIITHIMQAIWVPLGDLAQLWNHYHSRGLTFKWISTVFREAPHKVCPFDLYNLNTRLWLKLSTHIIKRHFMITKYRYEYVLLFFDWNICLSLNHS